MRPRCARSAVTRRSPRPSATPASWPGRWPRWWPTRTCAATLPRAAGRGRPATPGTVPPAGSTSSTASCSTRPADRRSRPLPLAGRPDLALAGGGIDGLRGGAVPRDGHRRPVPRAGRGPVGGGLVHLVDRGVPVVAVLVDHVLV